MTFNVRPATSDDAQAIAVLAMAVQAMHAEVLPDVFKPAGLDVFPPATVQAMLRQTDHFVYVATDDDEVIGYIQAEVQHEPATPLKYDAAIVYIRQMGVAAAYQRRGIGQQLLDAIRREAADRELTTIMLSVYAANDDAREFYLRYGFVPYREDLRLA